MTVIRQLFVAKRIPRRSTLADAEMAIKTNLQILNDLGACVLKR